MTDTPFQISPTDFAAPKANTRIEYMYRDASNYKQSMTAVLPGALTLEQAVEIVACTDRNMGDSFLPAMVGLASADWSSDGAGAHYGDDHPWHELVQIEPTDDRPNEDTTAAQFLAAMQAAHKQGWIPENAAPPHIAR